MSSLLNRKYGSRLECLYYILQSCYKKYGTTKKFSANSLKYDDNDEFNVHYCCKLTTDFLGKQKCCPFLQNPLDLSKCYATQSVESDSTKSKAVSDICGSLEALGFIKRISSASDRVASYRITDSGEEWAKSNFYSQRWEEIALKGVLSYGLIIGFLAAVKDQPQNFTLSKIYLGYPQTEETVDYSDESGNVHTVDISTGSQKDSVTRTRSRVIGWCVSVGLIEPVNVKCDSEQTLAHLKYRDFLNQKELTARSFKKTDLTEKIFDKKFHVDNPLAYSRLHKSVRAMRENGGEILRKATMESNDKILNRRFVFTYVLNHYSKANKGVDFNKLVTAMDNHRESFFNPDNDASAIMASESQIANFAGIPFTEDNGILTPLTKINEEVLCEDAPLSIVELANTIIKELNQK